MHSFYMTLQDWKDYAEYELKTPALTYDEQVERYAMELKAATEWEEKCCKMRKAQRGKKRRKRSDGVNIGQGIWMGFI